MGDENTVPSSKKRAAGRELSRDNPGLDDEEDVSEQEAGTFKKASDEVLASRKIVKVRRQKTSSAPSAPAFNPFAGIRLVPPVPTTATDGSKKESQAQSQAEEKAVDDEDKNNEPDEKELEEKTEIAVNESSEDKEKLDSVQTDVEKEAEDKPADTNDPETNGEKIDEPKTSGTENGGDKNEDENEKKKDIDNSVAGAEAPTFSSFQQLSSSKNAFTGLVGTGFSSSAFGSPSGSGFAFGSKTDQTPLPSFSFGASNNGSTSLFGATGASENKNEGAAAFPSMNEVSVETGEENEETVFTADSALFEYSEGGWKERGKGEVKINVSNSGSKKARLVMRGKGNYRLILNAYLYADMKLTKMDKKGITFACVNSASEGKTGLATFALKFKEVSIVETFSAAVTTHKGETSEPTPDLETPENTPKTAEE